MRRDPCFFILIFFH
jgi:hypothetical protein